MLRAGSPELIRRWVAALLMVPEADRPTVVREVTARIAEEYAAEIAAGAATESGEPPDPMFHIASDPIERDGHTEQIIRSYAPASPPKKGRAPGASRSKRA